MKKIIIVLVIALMTSCASKTSFNTFYQDNQEDSDFSFGISSSLVASFLDDDDIEDIKPLLKKAKHVKILVFTENYDEKSVKFKKFIDKSQFDKLMRIKDNDDNIAFFTLEDQDKIKEMVLEISTGDELVLIGLKTNMTPEDLEGIIEKSS